MHIKNIHKTEYSSLGFSENDLLKNMAYWKRDYFFKNYKHKLKIRILKIYFFVKCFKDKMIISFIVKDCHSSMLYWLYLSFHTFLATRLIVQGTTKIAHKTKTFSFCVH